MSIAKRILIVEDQRLIAADLENTLRKLGYEVAASVATREDAVQQARETQPDLILMDIRLRGEMDGIQAALIIRTSIDVPMVYLTAYADEETISRARTTSPFGYLVKPFNERELRAAIEIAITKHETDRLLVEERSKRRAAEEFKLFVEGVKDYAIFMLDPSGRVASWNAGARRITGSTAEEVLGEHISSVLPSPEEAGCKDLEAALEEARRDSRAEREGWRLRKDGSRFWGHVVLTAIRGESGPLHGFGKIVRDLTEHRRDEIALKESAARNAAMIASALDAIVSMDARGKVTEFNPAAERTFGYTREEAIGKEMATLIIPERLRAQHRAGLATFLQSGESAILGKRIEMPALCRDGSEITVELSVVAQPGAEPSIFTGFIRDITEQKRAEARRRFLDRTTVALAASLDTSTTLPQAARIMVPEMADWCLIDLGDDSGGLVQVAAAHVDLEKQETARLLGRLAAEPDLEHGSLYAFLNGKAQVYPEIHDTTWAGELLGTEHPELLRQLGVCSYICMPIQYRGRTLGVLSLLRSTPPRRYTASDVGCAEEIARRIAMAIDNARLYDQAQNAIRARDEFLQIASHELRTPLTPLQLQLDSLGRSLQKAGVQNPRLSEKLAIAARQITRLVRLVESLLDVSRISAGRVTIEIESFDLAELVREVVSRFQAEAQKSGSKISVGAAKPIRGRWDRLRVEQIVSNLVANAIKYGEGRPIEVDAGVRNGTVRISVTDHGIGIDKEALGRIFGRFERAVSTRHFGGLGLGLFIARQFAEAHGGTIVAQSQPGAGSTFTVVLPLEAMVCPVDRSAEQTV